MSRRVLIAQSTALALAIGLGAAFFGNLLLTPVSCEVLLLLTARQAERVGATSVDLHSAQGWIGLGSIPKRAVPQAPQTADAFTAQVPVGSDKRPADDVFHSPRRGNRGTIHR